MNTVFQSVELRYGIAFTLLLVVSPTSLAGAAKPGKADKDAPQEFTTTDSGLRYRILRKSEGQKASKSDTVTVHYQGWLDDKTVFDSSYQRDKPATFPLNQVIKGWTEGMQLIGEGGMIELEIPAPLGYGKQGAGNVIPPDSTLHFLVELVKVQSSQKLVAKPGKADKDAPQEFTTTDSGLRYRILRKSNGKHPAATDTVTVHYRGWLDDKTVFDSSYKRGKPATFPLNQVIKGWTEGMQLVGEGGMVELEIPASLGYGEQGAGNVIPPDSTLHFLVELIKIQ